MMCRKSSQKAFNDTWSPTAVARTGNEFHHIIKFGVPPPPGAYIRKFVWFCLKICCRNQTIAMNHLYARTKRWSMDGSLRIIPPPWVHVGNPELTREIAEE